ncbi:MAG: hypothetical protein WCI90_00440 [Chlorobium sp.]|nr:MAG: hypothetical protein FDX17_12215 [Chlorobium sp.]
MALTTIDTYQVMYSANSFFPRIWLQSAGKNIGQLIFHPNGAALPPDTSTSGQAQVHYHLDDFENVIGLLKTKPVSLLYSGSGGGFENGIETAAHPVGS